MLSPTRKTLWAPALALLTLVALASPQAGEAGAEATRVASDPRDGIEMTKALALSGDPKVGARSYKGCAVCHGGDGAGRTDGTFPVIAGQHATVIVKQLIDMRAGRRHNPVMETHVLAIVDARELADLVAYVANLPPPGENGVGDGGELETGKRLFERDCVACHGQRAEGDSERFTPALAGQHYGYLLRQVRAIAGQRRRGSHTSMAETVAFYRDVELRAVVDYLSRLDRRAGHTDCAKRGGPEMCASE